MAGSRNALIFLSFTAPCHFHEMNLCMEATHQRARKRNTMPSLFFKLLKPFVNVNLSPISFYSKQLHRFPVRSDNQQRNYVSQVNGQRIVGVAIARGAESMFQRVAHGRRTQHGQNIIQILKTQNSMLKSRKDAPNQVFHFVERKTKETIIII